jgi:integrase
MPRSSHPPNLYRRGETWWGCKTIAGRKHRVSLRTTDRREAERRFKAWETELTSAVRFGVSRMTWRQAVVRYLEEVAAAAVKEATYTRYRVSLRQIGPHLEDLHLDQITTGTVGKIVKARKDEGATNATIQRDLTAASRVMAAAMGWEACDQNPFRAYDRSLVRERREAIVPPEAWEVEAVVAEAPGLFAQAIRFLALTGVRQEEAFGLEWRQVDLKAGTITLTATKSGRPRTLSIADACQPGVAAELRRLLERLPRHLTEPHVFWHSDGDRYQNAASRFRLYVTRAEEAAREKAEAQKLTHPGTQAGPTFRPFRCHDLRHRYAIEELKAGRGIYELSRHLGHSSVKVTEIYLGYVPGGHTSGTAMTQKRTQM